jgi:hypothetical protein
VGQFGFTQAKSNLREGQDTPDEMGPTIERVVSRYLEFPKSALDQKDARKIARQCLLDVWHSSGSEPQHKF